MKQRPWPIILLAWFHFLAPIGNFFFSSYIHNVDIGLYFKAHFEAANIGQTVLFFGLPILAAISIYLCKKWSFWAYFGIMFCMITFSFMNWRTNPSLPILWLVFLVITNVVLVGYFLIPAVRAVYFDPRLRWWETKPRYNVDYVADVKIGNQTVQGKIMNLSEGGVFVQTKESPEDGSKVSVQFQDADKKYDLSGTAIHHAKIKEMGIGIQFDHTPETSAQMKNLTKKLASEGKLVIQRRPGPEDSFSYWFKGAITSGEGLVPHVNKKSE